MTRRYIKKPIPIEAVQFDGSNMHEVEDFCQDAFIEDGWLKVHALEGDMRAPSKVGDYVVKGAKGEFYICEKQTFEETYAEVDDRQAVCASMLY